MTDTAEQRPVSPGMRLSAMGPHPIAGRMFYARSDDLPKSVTMRYSTEASNEIEFLFAHDGEELPLDSESIDLGRVGALNAVMRSEGQQRRVNSFRFSSSSREMVFAEVGAAVKQIGQVVMTKTHLRRDLMLSASASLRLLNALTSAFVEELQAHLNRDKAIEPKSGS